MILFIILVILAVVLFAHYFSIIMLFASIISSIFFIVSYLDSKKEKPTDMRCPNCGCEDIKIQSLKVGEVTQSNFNGKTHAVGFKLLGYRTFGKIDGNGIISTFYKFKRQGICQKCGFGFDYMTKDEIEKKKKTNEIMMILSFFLAFVFLIFTINSIQNDIKENTTKNTLLKETDSLWASEYTSIDNFDYYLDKDQVYIKKYNGTNKKIKIASSYVINGKKYDVVSFPKGVFALSNVYSVILPDGLEKIASNTFNSCGIKYLYIPSTLQPDNEKYSFYNYFHNVEMVYYGGTEEQWKVLTKDTVRSEIDVKEIKYNVSSSELY